MILAILAVEHEIKPLPKIKFILIYLGLFLSLFAGLRAVSVSRDYAPYLGTFSAIMHGDFKGEGILPLFEPAFVLIVQVSYTFFISNPAVVVMLIFAFLSLNTKLYVIQKLSFNPFLVLLLYYSHYFMIQEMTQIRNGMACSFFLLAIYQHVNDHRFRAMLFIVLAFLFHNSAIFYVLLLFMRKDSLNPYLYGSLFFGAMVLGVLKIPFLNLITGADLTQISNKLTSYVDMAEQGYFSDVRFFNVLNSVNVLMTGYLLFYCIRFKVKDPKLILFLKCNIISIFVYGLLIPIPSMAARFAELFGAVFPFLFAYGTRLLPFKKLNIILVIGIAAIYFYIDLFYGKLLNPYDIVHFK